MRAQFEIVSTQIVFFWRRFAFGAKAREESWRLLGDLVASGMSLSKALETAAQTAEHAGRTTRAAVLRDIEGGVAGASVHRRVRRYVRGAEALVFQSIGTTDAVGIFRAAARLAAQQNKLSSALRTALAMPAILIVLMGIICYIMGAELFPIMADIGNEQTWPLIARITSTVTQWFVGHVAWVVVPLVALTGLVGYSLPNWTGKGRGFADRFAPYSLYKLQQGTAFIFTVIELGKMGQTISPRLLENMARDASPYLQTRMSAIAKGLSSQSLGRAMREGGHEFPALDLVTVCEALDDTEGWVERFAAFLDRWLELLEGRVKEQIAVLNALLMVLLAVVLGGVAASMVPLLTITY